MQFSRLEWRELLRCIVGTDCDPDVIAKVKAAIEGGAVLPAAPIIPRNAPAESVPPRVDGPVDWMMKYESWMANIDPRTNKPIFTPQEVDRVNDERRIVIAANAAAAQGIPYDKAAPPAIPQGHGIVHTQLGERNRSGDTCIGLRDPRTGAVYRVYRELPESIKLEDTFSIFQCRHDEMHGSYADENPNRPGCPRCFMGGMGESPSSASSDGGVGEREEPF